MTSVTATPTPTPRTALTPWNQSNANPSIIQDLFPTSVKTPTRTIEKARFLLTYSPVPMLMVFTDGPQGPVCVLEAVYDPTRIYGDSRQGFDVYAALDPADPTTASVVELRPSGNCGCGSALKAGQFHPFSTMRHSAPPPAAGPLPAPPVLPPNPNPAPAA